MRNEMDAFTAEEIGRLAVYKAAVAAGFYTDDTPEQRAPQRLSRAEVAYLFSAPGWRFQAQP
jgi:hypothetical protein